MLAALTSVPVLVPRAAGHLSSASVASAAADAGPAGATIERPSTAPVVRERPAQTVVTAPGDTVESLAAALHSDPGALRWANLIPDVAEPAAGTPLLIPPGPGALAPVSAGERPSQVAERLRLEASILLDYNRLLSDAALAGGYLQVPRAAAPRGALNADEVVPTAAGAPAVASPQYARAAGGRFPYGQCTYYVWTRRYVPWDGNAWEWYRNAQAFGRPVGQVPVAGAIAVMWGSWVGHVAFVERVNADGSFVISEMNFRGVGVVDQRTITAGSVDLIGFIY